MDLHYELSVLTKACHYPNLSVAAMNIGLSQPQLSRIVQRIELELQITLLDRSAKRKSAWTPTAHLLTEIFQKNIQRLEGDLRILIENQKRRELHMGTLEGMQLLAVELAHFLFEEAGFAKVYLDIFDLNELSGMFFSGALDLIFTSQAPSMRKYKNLIELGYQEFVRYENSKNFGVFSGVEYLNNQKTYDRNFPALLISNSLQIRSTWLDSTPSTGKIPGPVIRGKKRQGEPVFCLAQDHIESQLWRDLTLFFSNSLE